MIITFLRLLGVAGNHDYNILRSSLARDVVRLNKPIAQQPFLSGTRGDVLYPCSTIILLL